MMVNKDKIKLTNDSDDFEEDFQSEEESDVNEKVFNFKLKAKNLSTPHAIDEEEFSISEDNDDEKEIERDGDYADEPSGSEKSRESQIFNDQTEFNSNEENDDELSKPHKLNKKLKRFSTEELEKEKKRIRKTGVCYLSKIPPYMKPAKLRSILSNFGTIDRLFLKPEDSTTRHKRVKYGGNKKKNFTEGWAEFVKKGDAKLCAATLNGNKIGGKKTSYYYDDIINIKYLPKFKWIDLTQQIARENDVRQAKLTMELSQQNKLNKAFISNVEKSKLISNIQKKRKSKNAVDSSSEDPIRRNFKQRKITTTRSDASEIEKRDFKPDEKLSKALSNVF
ncbi:unnamed protein product [Candida verbasci]|uniref:Pre-rRNA-processing protein ESF2 n=1 Tax=Candida verbasci TaxID=1227364 RepID=A0A9W4U0U2_9ASCO|nr:unnamed protein product [Candida verbasci]